MNNPHNPEEPAAPLTVELIGGPLDGTILEWPAEWIGKTVRVCYCRQRASAAYEHVGPRHAWFVQNSLVYTPAPPAP